MTPIDDPRPFSEVLRDWMERHGLTDYAAAKRFGARDQATIRGWREGRPATYEPALRALMALVDQQAD